MFKKSKFWKRLLVLLLVAFTCMNVVAYFHAYKFTHFNPSILNKTKNPHQLSFVQKLGVLLTGIDNPRPVNKKIPERLFDTVTVYGHKKTSCWFMKTDSTLPRGTVILFHGYSGEKSSMLANADLFLHLGYNALVVDFMGSGFSEGNQTTIGFYEAEQVRDCFNYIKQKGEKHVVLYGTSMGAAAIMKSVAEESLNPDAVILECPFGSMLKTVKARFNNMHVPAFPMAHLLVFWGGLQNDFNAFKHNPQEYAVNVKCPTLLMYGLKDTEVSQEETQTIFTNLPGNKTLKVFPKAAHESYIRKYKEEWLESVTAFLGGAETKSK